MCKLLHTRRIFHLFQNQSATKFGIVLPKTIRLDIHCCEHDGICE
jgi:hypothetical protein